ncbi:AMP-dependent synthetase/ligase [Amycolatopsis thermoflava]|uniref:Acyl-CoA synthetase n=1 Tax=Amycolatopsis thermoflava TaxID=84480 RepID=A0A3N2H811_9PSEU|nr:AMP-dependent synthetase/ligase [Amycolatopsis thermoflava]ROS44245.1 long-chain acyl-CoA synthetase [Amycolatopsis thermoflava]
MKTSFTGNGFALAADRGLYSVLEEGLRRDPDRPVLSRVADGAWRDVTYAELTRHVRAAAAALRGHGVRRGDRVAILGRTSYEWAVADFAALALGAVAVPVYPTASEHQIRHVLTDSGAQWFAAETDDDASRLQAAGAGKVWTFAEVGSWRDDAAPPVDSPVAAVDLATIVYTSGTTGLPKGCLLTHANMYASSANTVLQTDWLFHRAAPGDAAQAATLLALPLSHVFGRTILLSCLIAGTRTGLVAGIPDLLPALRQFRPTFLALVPYALEKLRKLGGDLLAPARYVICGGASLDDTTAAFYAEAGTEILNCYGLTEAATAVTVNAPATNRRGTVGRPIPGTTVGIAGDGEVLVRGANVSPGYWPGSVEGDPGWLHTGDLGELDDDGYLRITGRRKEILVTSGGKNVAPTLLEDRIRLHPKVSNCMVVGDGRPFVTALITVDGPVSPEELQPVVDEANSLVSRAESIRAFRIVAGDFTVEAGQLTPSMKLRRAVIEEAYAADIAQLYGT